MAAFRDKRYTIPNLSVDLFAKVYPTGLWSFSQIILKDYPGGLTEGEKFTGAFTFESKKSAYGLFEARAVKIDTTRKMLGAKFEWVSKPGNDLMEEMNSFRNPDSPVQPKEMRVTMTYPTINWSLSGMLVGQWFDNEMAPNTPLRGMIRIERVQESGTFSCAVVRVIPERKALALKFTNLASETFALLEAAMKKS